MNNRSIVEEVDDEAIESGYFEELKKIHFNNDAPIVYAENDDPHCKYVITEYPDGRKERHHIDDLDSA